MGGMGVRSWEIARSLSQNANVTLAVPNLTVLSPQGFEMVSYDLKQGNLKTTAEKKDAIILSGPILHFHPYLRELGIPMAVDLYVPSCWNLSSGMIPKNGNHGSRHMKNIFEFRATLYEQEISFSVQANVSAIIGLAGFIHKRG